MTQREGLGNDDDEVIQEPLYNPKGNAENYATYASA